MEFRQKQIEGNLSLVGIPNGLTEDKVEMTRNTSGLNQLKVLFSIPVKTGSVELFCLWG